MLDRPLQVTIESTELVIRIGLDTLKTAAEGCLLLCEPNYGPFDPPFCEIVDKMELAKDVGRMIDREEEDGSSPLRDLIDKAILAAMEDGSLAFEDDPGGPKSIGAGFTDD